MGTKFNLVLDTMLANIRSGKYRRSVFPSVNQVVRQLGVGRKTVERAFDELVRRGLIFRRQGSGSFLTAKAKRTSGRIGLIVHGSDYCEIFGPIARRISCLCQERSLMLLFADLSSDVIRRRVDKVTATAAEFVSTHVDGVIFQPVEMVTNAEAINRRILEVFNAAHIPVVLLDSDIVHPPERSTYDLAAVNHFNAGRKLGEYLVKCGARRVAYLMTAAYASCAQECSLGVKIGAEGCTVPGTILSAHPENTAEIRKILQTLHPDAFVCYNDREARLLISTLTLLGKKVPDDVMVAGFDDIAYATSSLPGLTTLHQPCDELAKLAFEMLMNRIDNPTATVRETFLDARLVIRNSTRPITV